MRIRVAGYGTVGQHFHAPFIEATRATSVWADAARTFLHDVGARLSSVAEDARRAPRTARRSPLRAAACDLEDHSALGTMA